MTSVVGRAPETTGQTRVTLAGRSRRVDVVVPSGEPVGRLVPEALRLVGEPAPAQPLLRHLVTLDGRLLDPDASLRDAGVLDGAVLRVVGLAEAPPPPAVLDVTEEVADGSSRQPLRWGPVARWWTCTAVCIAAGLLAARSVLDFLSADSARSLLLGSAVAVLLVGGAVARWSSLQVGTTLALLGGALGVHAALVLAPPGLPAAGAAALAVTATVAVLGATEVLGRGGLAGAAVALGALGAWVVAERALPTHEAAAVLALGSTVLVGVLPRLALVSAGLTALDDRRAADQRVPRAGVAAGLVHAHRALALATLAAAVSAATAGWRLAASDGGWAIALAALVLVVLAVRARAFPLVVEVAALVAAAGALAWALLQARLRAVPDDWSLVALLVVLVALAAALLPALSVPEHVRARLRRAGDRFEVVATVALLPVLVGVFGLYGRLLGSF